MSGDLGKLARMVKLRTEVRDLKARVVELEIESAEAHALLINPGRILCPFECSACGEKDAEMSGMCARDRCPKEHEPFTEVRWCLPTPSKSSPAHRDIFDTGGL